MNEVLKDVSELNKTKKELIKKLKHLEEEHEKFICLNNDLNNFVHAVSHDLKSPINHLRGLIEALVLSIPKEWDQEALLDHINSALNNLKTRVEDLAELGNANETGDYCSIAFGELMKEVKYDLQVQIKESDTEIIEDFSKAPTIHFSKKNLRSILYNLISNSVKYRAKDRRPLINVTSEKLRNNTLLLKVSDNGMGISEEDKYKIFLMYKRLVNNIEGKGVGLALVKRIVDNAEGKIEVESELGKGTVFKLYLKG